QVEALPEPAGAAPPAGDEWRPLLDRELSRLPDKYRVPVVLCELEGRARKGGARQLAIPEGTLSSRLAAARPMLARRLARCGVVLSAAAVAAALSPREALAGVAPALVASTVQTARGIAGGALSAVVAPGVAALLKRVGQTMLLHRLKKAGFALLVLVLVGTGVGFTLSRLDAQPGQNSGLVRGTPGNEGEPQKKPAG